jgi:hypothetical protein
MSKTVKTQAKPTTRPAPASTNDTGAVHVGGGLMRFAVKADAKLTTADAGRVHVGGGLMRF